MIVTMGNINSKRRVLIVNILGNTNAIQQLVTNDNFEFKWFVFTDTTYKTDSFKYK